MPALRAVWLGVLLVYHPNTYMLRAYGTGFNFPSMVGGKVKQATSFAVVD